MAGQQGVNLARLGVFTYRALPCRPIETHSRMSGKLPKASRHIVHSGTCCYPAPGSLLPRASSPILIECQQLAGFCLQVIG